MPEAAAFTFDGGRVEPGETRNLRYTVSETYLGDPVQLPVTVVNGEREGPTVCLTAAAHGDELNGIEVVRTVAHEWDHADRRGTLVCLPVLNVPAFLAQQRYLPIYDRDLNRSFPGSTDGTGARRMADAIFRNFVAPCDLGLDFHTSTRGRSNMLHVRADMSDDAVARLANAFASHVIIDKRGPSGALRREATAAGTPTVAVEMGAAERFQRDFIDAALSGVESVFAEFGLAETGPVRWPGWRAVVDGSDEKSWVRADAGGLVEMHADRGDVVDDGEPIATISNPFKTEETPVRAPATGLLVGVVENPLVYPGNPVAHLLHVDESTRRAIERSRSAH